MQLIIFRHFRGEFRLSVLIIRTLPTRGETITVGLKKRNERFHGNSLERLRGMKILHLGFADGANASRDCLLCHCPQICVVTTSIIIMNSYEEKSVMAAVFCCLWLWRFVFLAISPLGHVLTSISFTIMGGR